MMLSEGTSLVAQGGGGTGGLKVILSRVGQLGFIWWEEDEGASAAYLIDPGLKNGLEGPRSGDHLLGRIQSTDINLHTYHKHNLGPCNVGTQSTTIWNNENHRWASSSQRKGQYRRTWVTRPCRVWQKACVPGNGSVVGINTIEGESWVLSWWCIPAGRSG